MRKLVLFFALLGFIAMANPLMTAQADGTKTVTLAVENMTCSLCPITVRKALEKVPGVAQAKVSFESKTAAVTFDPGKTTVEALTRATTNAGYPSTVKEK